MSSISSGTSEAPQDVAALPQTEADRAVTALCEAAERVIEHHFTVKGHQKDGCWDALRAALVEVAEAAGDRQEAAAGLQDQNDRLRSAVRTYGVHGRNCAMVGDHVTAIVDCTCGFRSVLRGSGAEEAAPNG